jgi:hypothetical protein
MLSPRWLIGVTLFMVFAFVLSNWIDGTAMFSNAQATTTQVMTGTSIVAVTSSTGSQINYLNILPAALAAIGKALLWDYSFLHDTDPVTGKDANTDFGTLLFIIRMAFMAITVGVVFQMAYLLRQIITG